MKRVLFFAVFLFSIFCCVLLGAAEIDWSKVSINGAVVPAKLSFAPGETMTFVLNVDFGKDVPEKLFTLVCRRTGDDGKTEEIKSSAVGPVTMRTSMDKPGFVRIFAKLVDADGKDVTWKDKKGRTKIVFFDGGAGVEVDLLRAKGEPADFDAYWQRQKEKLAAVPLKAEMKKLPSPTSGGELFAVKVSCPGPRSMTGYLTMPSDASKAKQYPVKISFHGYGVYPQIAPRAVVTDKILLFVNAHGHELGLNQARMDEFAESIKSNGKPYAFDPIQNADPETCYFNGMALRVMRALEFVKSLPGWNGRDLEVAGGSQGGLQTIWAAALDHSVSSAAPSIPWCADLRGIEQGRMRGWRPDMTPGLAYYDAAFHAARIQCPVFITRAGLGDYVCPPSGVASLYNAIKAPKKIHWVQGSTHGFVPQNPQIFDRAD